MTKKTDLPELAQMIRAAYSVSLYEQSYSSNKTHVAQHALEGRTHYVDAGTLRCFHSRIAAASASCSGLIFWIIESVAKNHNNTERGFRFVAFDVFGNTLSRSSLDDLRAKSDTARKDFYTWLETFDVAAHYASVMRSDVTKAKQRAVTLAAAARKIRL